LEKLGKKYIFHSCEKKEKYVKNINKFSFFNLMKKKSTKCWFFLSKLSFSLVLVMRKIIEKLKIRKKFGKKYYPFKEKKNQKKFLWLLALNKRKTSKLVFFRKFSLKKFFMNFSKKKKKNSDFPLKFNKNTLLRNYWKSIEKLLYWRIIEKLLYWRIIEKLLYWRIIVLKKYCKIIVLKNYCIEKVL